MKKTATAVALAVTGLGLTYTSAQAQMRQCATMDVLQAQMAADPSLAQRMAAIENQTNQFVANQANVAQRGNAITVTIPVVVHVVYNTSAQNVSDAQIASQISVLNQDYHKLNADASKTPSAFSGLVADVGIQFVLAKRDPNGNATTGIERKQSSTTSWTDDDAIKSTSTGGLNAWPAGSYLNLWVGPLGGGLLGYAQFPGGATATDGVVIASTAFGSGGSAQAPYDLGRSATHEVGHWLNLRHIWGDANCGNDFVSDTPTQQTSNGGCPSFPHVTCSNGPNGDMFMNYMDYTNDACMFMFSNGQSTRMNALFASGGARTSLLNSLGGTAPSGGGGGTPQPQPVSYCASKGNSVSYEYIDLVRLGSINRTSGADGGYYNGTATSTSVAAGSSQTISFSAGFVSSAYTEYFDIYADWNQDGDFADAGETLVSAAGSSSSATRSASFTVPSTAKSGSTRLRVVMSDNSSTTSCGSYSYGETEDYTITVTGGARVSTARLGNEASDYTLYPNPATSVLSIQRPAGADLALPLTVKVYDLRGRAVENVALTDDQLNVASLAPGTYLLTISNGAETSHQRFTKE